MLSRKEGERPESYIPQGDLSTDGGSQEPNKSY